MNKASICPCCMEKHAIKKVHITETTIFKNATINYNAEYYYCEKADEFYEDEELFSANDIALKDSYRSKMGLLTSGQIADIRKKYAISQNDLCTILGWGGKTITRYESHQVQDKAHDTILRKLDKDPEWFLELLNNSKDLLPEKAYSKSQKAGVILFENYHDNYLKFAVLSRYIQYFDDYRANGNKRLSIDVVIDMINFYANSSKVTNLYLSKLMKMLWYADSLSFKRYGHAISGLVYRASPTGTEPIAYETIIDFSSVSSNAIDTNEGTVYRSSPSANRKYDFLTNNDKEILETVIENYGSKSLKIIEETMQQEGSHNNTSSLDIILYS